MKLTRKQRRRIAITVRDNPNLARVAFDILRVDPETKTLYVLGERVELIE